MTEIENITSKLSEKFVTASRAIDRRVRTTYGLIFVKVAEVEKIGIKFSAFSFLYFFPGTMTGTRNLFRT